MPSLPASSIAETLVNSHEGSIGFWHPELASTRKHIVKTWLKITLILGCAVLAFLSLYWGSQLNIYNKYSILTVLVVDFDGQVVPYLGQEPMIGPLVVETFEEKNRQPGLHLGYRIMSPADFKNDPLEVRQNIYHERNWAAVIVNANATALLRYALEIGNTSYDPMGSGQVVFVQARQETILDEYVLPELRMMLDEIKIAFGAKWVPQIVGDMNDSSIQRNVELAPQIVNPAIGFTTINLRPFDIPVATPATLVGLIYLVIFSFLAFPFYMPIHSTLLAPKDHQPLRFADFIVWRVFASITAFGFLSLCYSIVPLAFGVSFSRPPRSESEAAHASAYGRGSFMVYWMLNWVGMISFGLPSENMCMVLGFPWFSLWLIFWVICNVCTAFYFVPLSPGFYMYGYAWPMHHIVEASRTIIFDVHSRIGLNFGVLFVWCAVSLVLFPICAAFARRKAVQDEREKGEETA